MEDRHQSRLRVRALAMEPCVPGVELGDDLFEEGVVGCGVVERPDRDREHRRRDQPARRHARRAVALRRVPELRPRLVVDRLGVEDHVRDHAVVPLPFE